MGDGEMMHTKEPWAQNGHRIESRDEHGVANDGWIVAQCEGMDAEANTRRIVACVNALEGLNDYALIGGWSFRGFSAYTNKIIQQRDELLAALRALADCYERKSDAQEPLIFARQAIARAQGEAK